MGSQKNIIELNGKHYDALTGKIVDNISVQASTKPLTQLQSKKQGVIMDGVSRPPRVLDISKQVAQSVHKKNDTSRTLMRNSVKKPQPIIKQATGAHYRHPEHHSSLTKTLSSKPIIDPARIARAKQAPKSKLITKFNIAAPRIVGQPALAAIPVNAEPGHTSKTTPRGQTASLPFQKALDQATSHQQPRTKKEPLQYRLANKLGISSRVLSLASGALAILLIGGFIAYQNVPNLAMQVASARAGIHASLPGYKPAGFSISGPIQYKPGQIRLSFKSNSSDGRNFTISQSISSWNSETLLDNYVAAHAPYQIYADKGKTIYIYGTSNATWVDNGTWYNIEGNSSLSSDQLLRIADSI